MKRLLLEIWGDWTTFLPWRLRCALWNWMLDQPPRWRMNPDTHRRNDSGMLGLRD